MTITKKLLILGVVVGILSAIFVFLPESIKVKFLGSVVTDTTFTKTTQLAGEHNDITWTATDPAVTITYAAPAAQATTTVTVSGNDITVTPGTKAKMQINNVQVVHSVLGYAGQVNGYPMYSSDGSTSTTPRTNTTILYSTGSSWVLISWYDTLNAVFSRWSTSGPDATPDLITSWLPEGAGSGTPTIAPISSSASQVIAAVAANPTAAALISGTLASSNDGTGAVTAMATLHFPILERKFVTTWKTDNPGKTSSTQITIPTNPGINPNTGSKFVYNYKVEWGDGTSDMGVTGDKVHTYATAGTYTVSISGTFPSFQFKDFNSWADRKNESDSMKLLTVEEWGTNAWQSFENAFQSCENLEIKATDAPNLTAVKSMKYMFTGATKFNQPIGHWNVSNVVNMEGLFQNANTFNQDLSGWERTTPGNVSTIGNVTNMNRMFWGTFVFNGNIGNWNTSKVTDMGHMFLSAFKFNQDLNSWNVSNVKNMNSMFHGATIFNGNISNWNTSSVESINHMFGGAKAFNQDISNWNVSHVTNMAEMFYGAENFNQDISKWERVTPDISTLGNITDMSDMFYNAYKFNQDLSNWNVSKVEDMTSMFNGALVFNGNIGDWNVSKVEDMGYMFKDAQIFNKDISNWDVSKVTNMGHMFYYAYKFNQDISRWNVSEVKFMDHMFLLASDFNSDISNWNVSKVTNMMNMFSSATSFDQNLSKWERTSPTVSTVGNVTNMQGMFNSCKANYDISNWNVSKVTDMLGMFAHAGFNQDISRWDVSKVTDMSGMFSNNLVFNKNLSNWNVSNVTNMNSMFGGTKVFNQDISSWDVSKVTDMSNMFYNAVAFNKPLNAWGEKTSKVNTMSKMFYGATVFDQPLNLWNVSSVESMNKMFINAKAFNQDLNGWERTTPGNISTVGNVINMSAMFYGAEKFNGDIRNWNVSKVTDMNGTFEDAKVFNQDISNWNTSNVENMYHMFGGAKVFNQPIGKWNISKVKMLANMFYGADAFNQDLSGWERTTPGNVSTVGKVENMGNMFLDAKAFNQDISSWNVSKVSTASNMFTGSALSMVNYNKLLQGWSSQTVLPNVGFDASSKYCGAAAIAGRNTLTSAPKSWRITDGGLGDCKPNLVASVPTPTTATVGTAQTFTSTITNNGAASTEASFNNFFQVASAANGGGTLSALSVNSRALLAAGESGTVTSSSHIFNTPGTYSVRVCADNNATFANAIIESNETDNCSAWSNVTVSSISIPITTIQLTITGTVNVGGSLHATLVPSAGVTATYQWQSSNTLAGPYTNISANATGVRYDPIATDVNKYVRVVATGTGSYSGSIFATTHQGIGARVPLAAITDITGTAQVGRILTAGAVTPAGSSFTYQWKKSATLEGIYDIIPSATSSTYTPVAADEGKFIRVTATGSGFSTGEVNSAPTTAIAAATATTPPTITATSSNTTPLAIGETTTLTFTLSSASTNFTQDDITVVGGTLSQWTAVSSTVYTARFTPDTNRTTAGTINVAAGRFTNASGTSNTAMTQLSIQIDTVAPVTPAALTIPAQTGVTAWYYVTTDTFTVRVACTLGYTNKIYSRTIAAPTPVIINTTVCTNSTYMDVVINPGQESDFYSLSTTITDTAGNASGQSNLINIYKDLPETAVTVPGTPDMDALYDFGTSSSDNLTRETQPRFTISCTSGNTVNLYDGTNLIGSTTCMAETAQIIPTSPLAAGVHTLTAKQVRSTRGTSSTASSTLTITIDSTPLNVSITKDTLQPDPTVNPALQFQATFSKSIDPSSLICSDITVINGVCTGVTLFSENFIARINVTATNPGIVRASISAGRVETAAGNLNTASTGLNTLSFGLNSAPSGVVNGQCSPTLKTFSTANPSQLSLSGIAICARGTRGTVSYNTSRREWTYTCSGANGGTNATCAVGAVLTSAPIEPDSTCDLKPVATPPFESCSIKSGTDFFRYHSYLSCLNVIAKKKSCADAGCTQNAPRQELIYIAARLRGIPLETGYQCQNKYTDTVKGVPSWVCEVAEKGQIAGLISKTNKTFRPLDTMTRAEAFKVILGSICTYPTTTTNSWQNDVAKQAIKLGFSTRTVGTFEPNRLLLKQELYVLSARAAEWISENPDNCNPLPDELVCQ